jgi:lipopolysaccharide export LptBFGC system permease protein LptF
VAARNGRIAVLRIQRALLFELLFVFVVVTVVVTSAVFLGVTLRFVREGGGALGGDILLELVPRLVPIALSYSVPFSWLAASAMVLGRWASDREGIAIQASGVHLRVIVLPLVAVGCLLGSGNALFNLYVVAEANREVRGSLKDFLPQFLSSLRGADRSVVFESGRLSFDHWDVEQKAFTAVEMDRRTGEGVLAEKAVMESLRLEQVGAADEERGLELDLKNAYLITTPRGGVDVGYGSRAPLVMGRVERIGASTLFNEFFGTMEFLLRARDLTLPELAYADARGGVARGALRDVRIALHGRTALGSSVFFLGLFALAMVLVLPPTGRRVRDFLLCFLPAVLMFFPLHITGPSIARNLGVAPWAAMWAPNVLLLLTSGLLLARAFRR